MEGRSSSMGVENGKQPEPPRQPAAQWKAVVVASIAVGLSFGWALQFSLLTPYVQLLGIPHKWASFIWLCGPISGIVVQPLAGYYSDRCTSRYGRRRPFIAAAAALVAVSVVLIGFAADFGRLSGDPSGNKAKPRAITIFVIGFWVFDVGNNLLMAPCRALLADLSGDDQRFTRNANALFSFFTAVGNILGYAAGSYSGLHKFLPFTSTRACVVYCANLKSCLLISITLLLALTVLALSTVHEDPIISIPEDNKKKTVPFFGEVSSALKILPRSMWYLLLVASINSTAWFAWLLFDTDWMGREVYGGNVGEKLYDRGVHAGSMGLMLNAAVAGVTALSLVFVARDVKTGNLIWGCSLIFAAGCLASTVWITRVAEAGRRHAVSGSRGPEPGVKAATLALFALLGIPQAAIYTIPFALAATYSATVGLGQGLAMGLLNLAFVIPQLVVSLTSGPWDELFGGGNLPAFVVGAVAAAVSGLLILTLLPSASSGDKSPTIKTSIVSH